MTYMVKKRAVLLFIMFSFVLRSCSSTDSFDILFSNASCDLPCWENITPGYSTADEAIEAIKTLPEVDVNTIRETSGSNINNDIEYLFHNITFQLANGEQIQINAFMPKDEIVDSQIQVVSILLGLKRSPPLQLMIERFGEPEYVILTPGGDNIFYREIALFFPRNGMVALDSQYCRDGNINIDEKTKIGGILLVSNQEYLSVLYENMYQGWFYPTYDQFKQHLQTWNGYGEYDCDI